MADQKLSGLDEVSSLDPNDLVYVSDGGSKRITKYNLEGTIKPDEAVLADNSLQLGGVDADQYVQADGTNNNFISTSSGSGDAGKPISLNAQGKVDESMIGIGGGFTYIGSWTPTAGAEYPDTTGLDTGSFWTVDGLSADYTFTGGDLDGQVATNDDIMIWGDSGWVLTESQLDPSAYLPLTGGELSGNLLMRTDLTGKRFLGFLRSDGTFRGAIGNADTTEEFEVALANPAGDTFISNMKLMPDGNVRADFAAPADDKDLVTKEYGDANYLGGSGGGDFYADGHVPMVGTLKFEAEDSGASANLIHMVRTDGTDKVLMGTQNGLDRMSIYLYNDTGSVINTLTLNDDGNIAAAHASPSSDDHLITKEYGDANYGGGGGGDYLPLAGGTMAGDILMNADATGKRFIGFTRDNDTFKAGIGNQTNAEEFEVTLANTAGTAYVSNIKLIPDGNVRAEFATPAHDDDLVTKAYGDTHYLSGTGGGDFMADGSVPMTGDFQGGNHKLTGIADGVAADDAATMSQLAASGGGDFMANGTIPMTGIFQMNAPATGVMFSRILRNDGTLKLAYGSRDTVNQFELLLANAAGDVEVNKLILKENGNLAAPFASPAADDDLVTKGYGDTHYSGGGGGGDFMADGSVPMTGDFDGGTHKLTHIADGVAADDAATMSQLAASGGGDFMANGTIPMTGTMTFDAPSSGVIFTRILRSDGTFKLAYGSRDTANQFELLLANTAGDAEINKLLLKADGNIEAPFASPAVNGDLVTKQYGDANYLGGGGGDFYADGHVPMTGDLLMDADAGGSRAIQIRRDDGTLKCALGSWSDSEELELLLADVAGTTEVARLLLRADGNVAAPDATPTAADDLVTRAYGDAHYLGGGGGDYLPLTGGDLTGGLTVTADAATVPAVVIDNSGVSGNALSLRNGTDPNNVLVIRNVESDEVYFTIGTSNNAGSVVDLSLVDGGTQPICNLMLDSSGTLENNTFPAAPAFTGVGENTLLAKKYCDFIYSAKAETVLNMAGSVNIDAFYGTMLQKTLTTNTVFTISLEAGESVTLHLKGGDSFTAELPAGTKWVGDRPTVLTAHDVFIIWNDGTDDFASYSGAVT